MVFKYSRNFCKTRQKMGINGVLSTLHSKWNPTCFCGFPSHKYSFRFTAYPNLNTLAKFNLNVNRQTTCNFPRAMMGFTETTLHRDENSPLSLPPLPEQRIVVGWGTVCTDYLASVAAFPQPDEKLRSTDLQGVLKTKVGILEAPGIGNIHGRLLVGTAEAIPPLELLDTTGAGHGFIGAILYAIAANMSVEKMLPFAARVAAAGCRAVGARAGLPCRSDSRLVPYLI